MLGLPLAALSFCSFISGKIVSNITGIIEEYVYSGNFSNFHPFFKNSAKYHQKKEKHTQKFSVNLIFFVQRIVRSKEFFKLPILNSPHRSFYLDY